MRKLFIVGAMTIAMLIVVESISSYIVFRFYASGGKSLEPKGSATVMLVVGAFNKARGKHPTPTLSIDHGYLFETDPTLGYALHPGRYRIREQLSGKEHFFDLTVTDEGLRRTSEFPVRSDKRIFMIGDSSMFGWGLDDEETVPWQIQAKLPQYQVLNFSLTSYSTVQSLLQLKRVLPKVGPNDIVVVEYHPLSNDLNVASATMLDSMKHGYELALGEAGLPDAKIPYGSVDEQGNLAIQRISFSCAIDPAKAGCSRPPFDVLKAMQVTMRAFDDIVTLGQGHLVIVFLSGQDDDPVIAHLQSRGALVADMRTGKVVPPIENDVIAIDSHLGPFGQHQIGERLFESMRQSGILD